MRSIIYTFGSFLAFFLFDFSSVSAQKSANEPLKFVIRVDDILSRNTSILPRSILPLQDSIAARGAKVTWGVMPHRFLENPNLDGVLANELKQSVAAGHEASQHGYIHICQRCNRSSHEMYCTTFNTAFASIEQRKLIDDGIQLFEQYVGIKPTSFIPPGHVSDATTYQTLQELGINVFSDDTETTYLGEQIFNLPIQNEYTWALTEADFDAQLQNALSDIKSTGEAQGYFNMMMHDPFIRLGYNNGLVLRWVGALLDSLNAYYGPNIEYLTLTEAANTIKFNYTNTAVDDDNTLVKSFSLSQNYPNPFNPSTSLQVQLKTIEVINLRVFSIQGQAVAELANGRFNAGTHYFEFNASNQPSGQYIARLTTENGSSSIRKMLLIK